MKDWQEIVRLYEKDNVFLAEASQLLMRNVAYEIPSIKKSIAKCEQMQHVSQIILPAVEHFFNLISFIRNQRKKKQNVEKMLKILETSTNPCALNLGLKGKTLRKN